MNRRQRLLVLSGDNAKSLSSRFPRRRPWKFLAGLGLVGFGVVMAAKFRGQMKFISSSGSSTTDWPFVIPIGEKVASRKRKYPIRGVILHHTVTSSPQTTYRVFLQRGVSTHFEIAPDGKVWKYLEPETEVAFHTGQAGFNDRFIGVDLTGPPFTEEQIKVLPKFLEYLSKRYGFRLAIYPGWGYNPELASAPDKIEGVFGHAHVQSNKIDPSEGGNVPWFWNKVVASVQGVGGSLAIA